MLDLLAPIAAACDLRIPSRLHRGIAIVGAGAIVEHAHLPAYHKAGLPVIGVSDLDADRAKHLADAYGLRAMTFEDVLDDEAIEVVDIAVIPDAQPALAIRAMRAGKHVLAQKPLAVDSAIAEELVKVAAETGRVLVTNHQMRYGEGMAATRAMIEAGWLGEVTAVTIDVNICSDWSAWGWLVNSPRLDLMYHSIHYFDTIRSILGTPERVFCVASRRPGQLAAAETRTMTTMRFAGGTVAHVNVNHENIAGDYEARFRVDGSDGSVRGTIGLLYDYPHGRPDTVEVFSKVVRTDGWLAYPVTTRWIPDAFAGPMRALLTQVADGTPAPTTGSDAIDTLRVVEAGYASIASGQAQLISEAAGPA